MARYKALPPPSWLLWDDPEDQEMLQRTLDRLTVIPPVFNRPGWYFDRTTKKAWYEAHGKAWECDRNSDFLYELSLENHHPLRPHERAAIKTLIHASLADKKLRHVLWLDDCWFELRRIQRGTDPVMLAMRKEMREEVLG